MDSYWRGGNFLYAFCEELKMDYNLKTNPNKIRGDVIEVRLKDITLTVYFKQQAHINNEREMAKLIDDLREKGVVFPSRWF